MPYGIAPPILWIFIHARKTTFFSCGYHTKNTPKMPLILPAPQRLEKGEFATERRRHGKDQ
jgi:hypothetical protein